MPSKKRIRKSSKNSSKNFVVIIIEDNYAEILDSLEEAELAVSDLLEDGNDLDDIKVYELGAEYYSEVSVKITRLEK